MSGGTETGTWTGRWTDTGQANHNTQGGTGMPRGFRHGGGGATSGGGDGQTSTPQPAWVTEFLDLLASAGREFSPENARAMVEVVDHYPKLLHGMSQFAKDVATRSVEAVEMPPAAAESLLSLAGIQERMADAVESAMGSVRKVLDWHIQRASSGSAKVEAWDVRRWENAGR